MLRDSPTGSRRNSIAAWLFACCALVFAMVVVGGITRLTHSGLSIVEWQPVAGALPPMNEVDWQAEFDKYKLSPEFRQRNFDMTLAGFKGIFWWEYGHRLLGRTVGAVFLLPFLWFFARGELRGALAWRLVAIFALGGLQGLMGWLMVKSGLVDDPRVSSMRLAAHLGIAFVIYAAILWTALGLSAPPGPRARRTGALARLARSRGARARDGAHRRPRRGNPRRLRVQHVPDDEWLLDPARSADDRAVVAQLRLQHGHGAARSSPARVHDLHLRLDPLVAGAPREARGRLARVGACARGGGHPAGLRGDRNAPRARAGRAFAALHQAGALMLFTCALGLAHALQGPDDYTRKERIPPEV